MTTPRRPAKYRNRKAEWSGQIFDSQAELRRYRSLLTLQAAGQISDLTRQVSFEIIPSIVVQGRKVRATQYRADFAYTENGKRVIEDVKGMATQVYRLKKKLMMHVHGIEIRETK